MASTPIVAIAGNTVTSWESQNDSKEPFAFCPQGDLALSDVAWNHNGQGQYQSNRARCLLKIRLFTQL